jgi:hypothetical protein
MNWDLGLGLAGVWFPILVPVLELFFEFKTNSSSN